MVRGITSLRLKIFPYFFPSQCSLVSEGEFSPNFPPRAWRTRITSVIRQTSWTAERRHAGREGRSPLHGASAPRVSRHHDGRQLGKYNGWLFFPVFLSGTNRSNSARRGEAWQNRFAQRHRENTEARTGPWTRGNMAANSQAQPTSEGK